jgi:hypothetical protein
MKYEILTQVIDNQYFIILYHHSYFCAGTYKLICWEIIYEKNFQNQQDKKQI